PLTNEALFRRDLNVCLYCGGTFSDGGLTRDHVVPTSRGGKDGWFNVVAACKRCNHHKGNRLLEECGMELLALPYVPNFAEYLALTNSGRILGDQMDFLRRSFGSNSRLLQ
ncbi:MAG: HNH endonuclease, partial [Pseudomonadales bacterium]